jgi:DNA-binding MarR family transcriptional regulator
MENGHLTGETDALLTEKVADNLSNRAGKRDMKAKRAVRKDGEKPIWDDNFERQVGFLLRKAYQRNMAIFQKRAPVPQITSTQTAALTALLDESPSSLTALGRKTAMDPATTRGVVERLSDRGLIKFVPDTQDRRKVMVHLEPEGREVAQQMLPAMIDIAAETMETLNEAEQIALVFLLEKIVHGRSPAKS